MRTNGSKGDDHQQQRMVLSRHLAGEGTANRPNVGTSTGKTPGGMALIQKQTFCRAIIAFLYFLLMPVTWANIVAPITNSSLTLHLGFRSPPPIFVLCRRFGGVWCQRGQLVGLCRPLHSIPRGLIVLIGKAVIIHSYKCRIFNKLASISQQILLLV